MAEFTASDLLAAAKARYKEQILRQRMAGAGNDGALADVELAKIAEGVVGRIRSAAQSSVGWPMLVTSNVLQHALELFNWRTLSGFEAQSVDQRKVGEAAEKFFVNLASGVESWGVGTDLDVGMPAPAAARDRAGKSLIAGIPDRMNALDILAGPVWDHL